MYKMSTPERPIRLFIPVLYSFVFVLLAVLVVVHHYTKIPFRMFTADPAASMSYHSFYGYISNIGILFWCSAATICILSAAILNLRKDQLETVRFLGWFGALTTLLMFDDLFMFHESIGPWYLNLPEKAMLVIYGMFATYCVVRFRHVILSNDIRYLILAFVGFGASVFMDQISERIYFPGEYLFEDGAKFIGIASWLVYFLNFSFNKIMAVMAQSQIDIISGRRMKKTRNREVVIP